MFRPPLSWSIVHTILLSIFHSKKFPFGGSLSTFNIRCCDHPCRVELKFFIFFFLVIALIQNSGLENLSPTRFTVIQSVHVNVFNQTCKQHVVVVPCLTPTTTNTILFLLKCASGIIRKLSRIIRLKIILVSYTVHSYLVIAKKIKRTIVKP